MKIPLYLAMTAAEFVASNPHPAKCGWMACHFSPYCTGLSNVPSSLPPNSLLIVNDITPIHGHDPERIYDTLQALISDFQCDGILLDFQREGIDETAALVKKLLDLPAKVCVSEKYASSFPCPVFLPPPQIRQNLNTYLSPWQNREIWLEAALSRESICITEKGFEETDVLWGNVSTPHQDTDLFCHYAVKTETERAFFYLQRMPEDLFALLNASADLGVTQAIGLYQELKEFPLFISPDL